MVRLRLNEDELDVGKLNGVRERERRETVFLLETLFGGRNVISIFFRNKATELFLENFVENKFCVKKKVC